MLNLSQKDLDIIKTAQGLSDIPDNGGRISLGDKILYALRDLDRHDQGEKALRHKSPEHCILALKRYLKEYNKSKA